MSASRRRLGCPTNLASWLRYACDVGCCFFKNLEPTEWLLERAARALVGSWAYGHLLAKPVLLAIITGARTRCHHCKTPIGDSAGFEGSPSCLPGRSSRHADVLVGGLLSCSRSGMSGEVLLCPVARQKAVLEQEQVLQRHMCGATLPSRHGLAAHMHRRHSVVNCVTRFTHSTACLWCRTEHHSTDRLKYLLKVSAACMHGLRVQTGEVYEYSCRTHQSHCPAARGCREPHLH